MIILMMKGTKNMEKNYSIYYKEKIIATARLTKGAESPIQLVTITPEGPPLAQPFTETILKPVSATLIDTIAIERAIHLCGLNPANFTISKKTQ
jgi:hypothetical protein